MRELSVAQDPLGGATRKGAQEAEEALEKPLDTPPPSALRHGTVEDS